MTKNKQSSFDHSSRSVSTASPRSSQNSFVLLVKTLVVAITYLPSRVGFIVSHCKNLDNPKLLVFPFINAVCRFECKFEWCIPEMSYLTVLKGYIASPGGVTQRFSGENQAPQVSRITVVVFY